MPLGTARLLGAWLGRLAYTLNTREARITRINLAAVNPEIKPKSLEQAIKNSLAETGKLAFEMNIIWQRDKNYLDKKIIKVHNEHLIKAIIESGQGLIILAPHMGNWEVLGKLLPKYGPVTNLYKPPKKKALEEFVKRSREQSGAQLVPTNTRGVATLLKRLKAGGISGILPDQVPDKGSGEFAPFFGIPTYTMTLIHGLLNRTQSQALVGIAKRVPNGFDIHFLEPDPGIYSEDKATSLAGLNKSVELAIELAPDQYQWEYKRFKRQAKETSKFVSYS